MWVVWKWGAPGLDRCKLNLCDGLWTLLCQETSHTCCHTACGCVTEAGGPATGNKNQHNCSFRAILQATPIFSFHWSQNLATAKTVVVTGVTALCLEIMVWTSYDGCCPHRSDPAHQWSPLLTTNACGHVIGPIPQLQLGCGLQGAHRHSQPYDSWQWGT